jgi:hypothetical protein
MPRSTAPRLLSIGTGAPATATPARVTALTLVDLRNRAAARRDAAASQRDEAALDRFQSESDRSQAAKDREQAAEDRRAGRDNDAE